MVDEQEKTNDHQSVDKEPNKFLVLWRGITLAANIGLSLWVVKVFAAWLLRVVLGFLGR